MTVYQWFALTYPLVVVTSLVVAAGVWLFGAYVGRMPAWWQWVLSWAVFHVPVIGVLVCAHLQL